MKISIYLAAGLVVIGVIVGIGVGYTLTPEYRTSMYDKDAMSLGRADRTFDLRYLNAMIAHHRGAMLLAEQLGERTARPEMRSLAEMILKDEPTAIDELYAWKKEWYGDLKRVRDPIVPNLGEAGETIDLRFLNAMIAHHEAGLVMTAEARRKSSRTEVLDNADAVEDFLVGGVDALTELRSSWYDLR